MTTLEGAIITQFQAGSTLSAVAGPWFDQAASDNASAYYAVMYDVPGSRLKQTYGTTYLQPQTIQFSLFGPDRATLLGYQNALHTKFDHLKLSLATDINISAIRMEQFCRLAGTKADGTVMYMTVSTYRFVVQREF